MLRNLSLKAKLLCSLAMRAGETIGQVVISVRQVTDMIGDITRASIEQTGGIDRVSATVMAMDEATQQNTGLVQQAAASAAAMRDQAHRLSDMVARFRLSSASRLAAPPVADAPSRALVATDAAA